MGVVDLVRIHPIYRYLVDNYPHYLWHVDSGNFETGIFIKENGDWTTYLTVIRDKENIFKLGYKLFVPDIICYDGKIVVEYQEQPKRKKHRGRYSKKGHTEFSDEEKDLYYSHAGIKQIKIWDDDSTWRNTLRELIDA